MREVNYTDVFNNALDAEAKRRIIDTKKAIKIKADMIELLDILVDVIKVGNIDNASVGMHKEEECKVVFIHGDSELIIQLTTDGSPTIEIEEKTVRIEGNAVHITEETIDEFYVNMINNTALYDNGVSLYSKEELYVYTIERVANLVAKN